MTYTAEQLLTLIGALGVLIAAFGAVIVNIIVALKTGQKTDMLVARSDGIKADIAQVHVLANSTLSAATSKLDVEIAKNLALVRENEDLRGQRAKQELMEAVATTPAAPHASSGGLFPATAPQPIVAAEPLPVRVVDSTPVKVETETERKAPKKDG